MLAACLWAAANHASGSASELRCGWFENPTPGNAWLTDRDAAWSVALQGGHQAEGDWPVFDEADWVSIDQRGYGYGCACLRVIANAESHTIERILSARPQPLKICRDDPALSEPAS